jgi:probable F420-dependent oxidoreductase
LRDRQTEAMHYGLTQFPTDYSIQPGELARAAEERGIESLWFAEHTHIPSSRLSPWPGGAELPKMYYDTYDPLIALTAAASATSKLKVGTGISLVIQHDPITLAKALASLDQISSGRVLFGVGGGWNKEEIENHGVPFERRFKILRERVEAIKAIWTQEKASYEGEFVNFDSIFSFPKPVQKPHPPIHVGGAAPHALKRVVRYGDGWIPILGRGSGALPEQIAEMRSMAREAGRDADAIEVTIYGCPAKADKIKEFEDMGVARVTFFVPSEPSEKVMPLLDRYATLVG